MMVRNDRNLESEAGRMCRLPPSFPPPRRLLITSNVHEVNRKSIRKVDTNFLCEFYVFFFSPLVSGKKTFKEKRSHTHTLFVWALKGGFRIPTRLDTLLFFLPKVVEEKMCVWWSCVLENLRRRQSFSKSRTAEIFVVALHGKILKMKSF